MTTDVKAADTKKLCIRSIELMASGTLAEFAEVIHP
jgi:hypothetical protein